MAQRSDHTDKTRRVLELERENRKLKRQLEQAEALIEVQKKVSRLLEAFSPAEAPDARDPKDKGKESSS